MEATACGRAVPNLKFAKIFERRKVDSFIVPEGCRQRRRIAGEPGDVAADRKDRITLGGATLQGLIGIERSACWLESAARIELENAGHHDDRLRPVAVFEQCEFERLGAIDE
jgi:hypothetical protein